VGWGEHGGAAAEAWQQRGRPMPGVFEAGAPAPDGNPVMPVPD
jgi:hypothetical protein